MTKELEGAPETIWAQYSETTKSMAGCTHDRDGHYYSCYDNWITYTLKSISDKRIAELEARADNVIATLREWQMKHLQHGPHVVMDYVDLCTLIASIEALKTESIAGIKIETDENLPENVIEARHPDGRFDRFTIKTESTT